MTTSLKTQSITSASTLMTPSGAGVLHSRHYHSVLLRVLYEADGIDAPGLLSAAATAGMQGRMALFGCGLQNRGHEVHENLRQTGLGSFDLSNLDSAGEGVARLYNSHFAAAWLDRYPQSATPVCAAAGAVLASALAEAHGNPLTAHETTCVAAGDGACNFRIYRTGGCSRPGDSLVPLASVPSTLDGGLLERFDDLVSEVFAGGLHADERGVIQGPGGPFTRLPTEFYASLTAGFERDIPRVRGPKFSNLPGILLLEAAHRNGFHLFGEILRSPAWKERVEACLSSVEEQLSFLLGVVQSLGWGSWEITSFAPGERLIVRVVDSYEAVGHVSLYGRSRTPRCYVARGAVAAMMNLLFRGEGSRGPALSASHYNQLFRSPATFRAVETRCRALGDPCCEIVANPLSL